MLIPAMRAICELPLTLLVTRVLADHEDRSVAADDLALLAHRLDRRSYLHDPFRLGDPRTGSCRRVGCRYRSRTRAHAEGACAETLKDSKGPAAAPRWRIGYPATWASTTTCCAATSPACATTRWSSTSATAPRSGPTTPETS